MRETCKTLKSIRKQIADANGITYEPNICTYTGPCKGTCPACEAEARYIEAELAKRQKAKQPVNIIGVAKDKLSAPSLSQVVAAATITATLSLAIPVNAATQDKTPDRTEKTNKIKVTGNVNDGFDGLKGAYVKIKGTNIYTETDKKGNFTIEASIGDTLMAQYDRSPVVEVKVTNTEKITIPIDKAHTVLVGGVSSLPEATEPLYVIDGKPINTEENSNPLASINPADIVDMEVLKDSSETAPYAAFFKKANNGVIIITTKNKGR